MFSLRAVAHNLRKFFQCVLKSHRIKFPSDKFCCRFLDRNCRHHRPINVRSIISSTRSSPLSSDRKASVIIHSSLNRLRTRQLRLRIDHVHTRVYAHTILFIIDVFFRKTFVKMTYYIFYLVVFEKKKHLNTLFLSCKLIISILRI